MTCNADKKMTNCNDERRWSKWSTCGSEREWEALQIRKTWMKSLRGGRSVSILCRCCRNEDELSLNACSSSFPTLAMCSILWTTILPPPIYPFPSPEKELSSLSLRTYLCTPTLSRFQYIPYILETVILYQSQDPWVICCFCLAKVHWLQRNSNCVNDEYWAKHSGNWWSSTFPHNRKS